MTNIRCPDCDQDMEVGYIPDAGDAASVIQMVWNAGAPEPVTIFGLKTGSVKAKQGTKPLPIWALRCPQCGLLRLHAIPKPDEESEA